MQGCSPKPCRRGPCPTQEGWPHRRARRETLRHTVGRDGATRRGLIPEIKSTATTAASAWLVSYLRSDGGEPSRRRSRMMHRSDHVWKIVDCGLVMFA